MSQTPGQRLCLRQDRSNGIWALMNEATKLTRHTSDEHATYQQLTTAQWN